MIGRMIVSRIACPAVFGCVPSVHLDGLSVNDVSVPIVASAAKSATPSQCTLVQLEVMAELTIARRALWAVPPLIGKIVPTTTFHPAARLASQ
jgi:hypothetical protein